MKESNLEIKVGIFVLAGLSAVAMLIVAFGKFGNYLKKTYPIVVELQDARDILKNSKVLWRGAQIGVVADTPVYQAGQSFVELKLKINDGIEIPTGARFKIDQYGMLGDRFVRVIPPEKVDGTFLQAGARVQGEQEAGLNAMLASAGPALEEIRSAARRVDEFAKAATGLVQDAEKGKGPLYTIMKDEKMATDMKIFMANLRKHGVLFYSDDAKRPADEKAKKTERSSSASRTAR